MLLQFAALVAALMLNDAGGGAAGEGEGNGSGGNGGNGEGQNAGAGNSSSGEGGSSGDGTQEPSANKLIKDFAKQRGISVEDLLDKYEELENAGKSEVDRLISDRDGWKSKYETATTELRDLRSESAFVDTATKANARSPRTLFRAYKSDLTFDKSGKPTNVQAVIDKLRQDEPDLFKTASGTGGDGGRQGEPTNTTDVNAALRGLKQ